jgi:hypothetical protein
MSQLIAFLITVSIYLTGSIAVAVGAAWLRNGLVAKRRPQLGALPPALWQCLGLCGFIAGFTFRNQNLSIIGSLLIALALLLETPSSMRMNPHIENVVLQLSLVSVFCLALLRYVL